MKNAVKMFANYDYFESDLSQIDKNDRMQKTFFNDSKFFEKF